MSKRERNRAARQAAKQERKNKLNEIISLATSTPDVPDEFEDSDFAQRFEQYWPLFKAGLEFAEDSWLTGRRTDAAIEGLIALGDNIVDNEVDAPEMKEFVMQVEDAWKVISRVLYVATVFTNDETDEVLEKIIDIGNWVTGNED